MAQRRMISKSISVSKKLAQVSPFSALLFTWLIPHCDDGGNMAGDAFTIKGLVIPMRPETVKEIDTALTEIIEIGLVDPYTINDERFVHIVSWEDHQTLRLDRATWEYPAYPKQKQHSATTRQPSAAEGKVREGKVSKDTYTESFEKFWSLYPRKVSKKDAGRAWNKINPDGNLQSKIMAALQSHCTSDQWTKDYGRFIPHPTTWLNQERWNDELKQAKIKPASKFDKVTTQRT